MTNFEKYKQIVKQIVDCNNRRNIVAEELKLIEQEHADLMKNKSNIQAKLDLEIAKEQE